MGKNADDVFVELCTDAGIKATQQRREIYRELAASQEHPDADMIYRRVKRRMPAVSLDTVYRNLRTLEECGIARRVGACGPRARYDANLETHHHFICSRCGTIKDFNCTAFDSIELPAKVFNYGDIKFVQVQLCGVCGDCGGKEKKFLESRKGEK